MKNLKVLIAGGSGFLGQVLARRFAMWDHEVVVLSRRQYSCNYSRVVDWDGASVGDWASELESATAIINLAGRSVNCRYNKRNRREIMDSRILPTRAIGKAIQACVSPPAAWLNMSTATIYKHTYGPPHDENKGVVGSTPEAKDGFSVEVATAWEREFLNADTPNTRKIAMRTALVLRDAPGGVFDVLKRLAHLGLGGRMAGGRQFVSWIHWIDFCCAVEWLVANPVAEGVYNLAAPNPVTNEELMRVVRRSAGARLGLPASRWMIELGTFFMRTEAELILKSRNVVPARLLEQGFRFSYPSIDNLIETGESETDTLRRERTLSLRR